MSSWGWRGGVQLVFVCSEKYLDDPGLHRYEFPDIQAQFSWKIWIESKLGLHRSVAPRGSLRRWYCSEISRSLCPSHNVEWEEISRDDCMVDEGVD